MSLRSLRVRALRTVCVGLVGTALVGYSSADADDESLNRINVGKSVRTPSIDTSSASGLSAGGCYPAPLFRFGLIADIQFCDVEDQPNFAGTEIRAYRGALEQTRRAVTLWNSLENVRFVAQLGDLIDGQNAGKYGAGLSFKAPQTEVAFGRVTEELARCAAPIYHAVGNHELYNFDWRGLRARLQLPARGWRIAADETGQKGDGGAFYYSWREPGWTMVMLNSYAVRALMLMRQSLVMAGQGSL